MWTSFCWLVTWWAYKPQLVYLDEKHPKSPLDLNFIELIGYEEKPVTWRLCLSLEFERITRSWHCETNYNALLNIGVQNWTYWKWWINISLLWMGVWRLWGSLMWSLLQLWFFKISKLTNKSFLTCGYIHFD